MPAKPLTPEQLADATRLRSAWDVFRRSNTSVTQEWLADQCGWKTQAAVSQYLLGRIPLNLPALLKFAGALGVSPSAISPALARQLPEGGSEKPSTPPAPTPRKSPALTRLLRLLAERDEDELERIAQAIELLLSTTPKTKPTVIEFTGLHPRPGGGRRKSS